jgi:hypothetical protein
MAKSKATPTVTGRPDTRTAKQERPDRGTSRAGGRPQRNARSIGDFRDLLGVLNKDPEKRYRWVLSTSDFDKRIFDAQRAGWEFVDATKHSDLIPGEYAVGKGNGVEGTFYRIPAGRRVKDEYLYLMWMPEEFALEVDAWKARQVDELEHDITKEKRSEDNPETGEYSIKADIGWEERHRPAG